MHIITCDQVQINADARHRGRWPLVLTVGFMFLVVVWPGTGVAGGNWLTLGRAACEASRGRAFCTGCPDSGRVSASFLPVLQPSALSSSSKTCPGLASSQWLWPKASMKILHVVLRSCCTVLL